MTGTEIATAVRLNTGDTGGNDPNDADMFPFINRVVRAIWENRIDSLFDSNGFRRSKTEITALTDSLDIDASFEQDIVNGVSGILCRRQGTNAESMAKAVAFLNAFKSEIGVQL